MVVTTETVEMEMVTTETVETAVTDKMMTRDPTSTVNIS